MTDLTNNFSKRWEKLESLGLQAAQGTGRVLSLCTPQSPAVTATPLLMVRAASLLFLGKPQGVAVRLLGILYIHVRLLGCR